MVDVVVNEDDAEPALPRANGVVMAVNLLHKWFSTCCQHMVPCWRPTQHRCDRGRSYMMAVSTCCLTLCRRARDDKAPARKAALGLLEAALLLRAELPAPAGGPPTAADTAAIAAATTDSLVGPLCS
jgi:hypothetical protein